jgi:hypothetical protein
MTSFLLAAQKMVRHVRDDFQAAIDTVLDTMAKVIAVRATGRLTDLNKS